MPGSGAVYADCWHNPGGGVDGDESDEQALRREVLEETGIDISQANVKLIDNKGSGESVKALSMNEQVLVKMQFNVYRALLNNPANQIEVKESDDLVGFRWYPIHELQRINLTPPARTLLERIGTAWLEAK